MLKQVALVSILVLGLALYLRSGVTLGKIVKLNEGSVQGIESVSRDGREYYTWHYIPYAKPPLGNLRFADPLPAEKWDGVRQGLSFGPGCPQIDLPMFGGGKKGDEDCLHLNVYVPKKLFDAKVSSKTRLPVLVYIHGGAYIMGSSEMFNGNYVMDHDIVLVSMNYRLDVLGFLTTGDKIARGNMGLKDQTLALKWVQQNIHHFGGDPRQVTIFGTSAGGASVHQQMLSPLSKGLFQKAFSQSGGASNVWGFLPTERALEKTKQFAEHFNCPTQDNQQLVDCLRKIDVEKLMAPIKESWATYFLVKPHTGEDSFGPAVEVVKDDKTFLTEHPVKVVADGKSHPVPWMVGFAANEGLMATFSYRKDHSEMTIVDSNAEAIIQKLFTVQGNNKDEISRKILDFYSPPSERSKLTFEEKLSKYMDLFGDAFFNYDIYEAVNHQRKYSPVYYYFHNKTDGPNFINEMFLEIEGKYPILLEFGLFLIKSYVRSALGCEVPFYGVGHAIDMAYYSSMGGLMSMGPGSEYYQYSRDLVRMLVDFMRDDTKMEFRGVPFPATPSTGPLKALQFKNEKAQLISSPYEARFSFLHSLGIRYSPKK